MNDPVTEFRAALESAGLIPGEIVDGIMTRCGTAEKPHSKNGAYVFHGDHPASGWFQNWRTGEAQTWTAKNGKPLTDAERRILAARVKADKTARLEEEAARHTEARDKAARVWEAATAAQDDHPYLLKKGVQALGEIRQSRGALVIPVLDERGHIQSLQFIDKDGGKRFLTGGKMAGGFFTINAKDGAKDGPLCICEGYATGASVHEATGHAVLCALNCGNLPAVAKMSRAKYPSRGIIICGDDDRETAARTGKNPGMEAAKEAAKEIKGWLAVPKFTDPSSGKDFNDLAQAEGLDAVRACLEKCQPQAGKESFLAFEEYSVKRFLNNTPPPIRWFFEDSWLQNTLGIFSAPGGSGKSFFCLQTAMGIASDLPSLDDLFKRGVGAYGKVFALFAEDSDDVLHHRFRNILNSFAPDSEDRKAFATQLENNLYIMSGAGKALNLIELGEYGNVKTSAVFDDFLAMFNPSLP